MLPIFFILAIIVVVSIIKHLNKKLGMGSVDLDSTKSTKTSDKPKEKGGETKTLDLERIGSVWEKVEKTWDWKDGIVPVFIGFIFIYCMVWILGNKFPDQTSRDKWHDVMIHPIFIVCIVMLVVFSLMRKKDTKNPFKHSFGSVGMGITIFLCVAYFLIPDGNRSFWSNNQDTKPSAIGAGTTTFPTKGCILPVNEKNKKIVVEFWKKNLPEDAEKMIAIAEQESQFNQYKNGEVYRRCPTPNDPSTDDVGVMQINEPSWLAKSQEVGYDIHTLDGNLKFALWIYKFRVQEGKDGTYDWRRSKGMQLAGNQSANKKSLTVVAPVGKWSEVVRNATYVRCEPSTRVKVAINGNRDEPYDDGPGITTTKLPKIDTLEYMAVGKQEATVTCTFTN